MSIFCLSRHPPFWEIKSVISSFSSTLPPYTNHHVVIISTPHVVILMAGHQMKIRVEFSQLPRGDVCEQLLNVRYTWCVVFFCFSPGMDLCSHSCSYVVMSDTSFCLKLEIVPKYNHVPHFRHLIVSTGSQSSSLHALQMNGGNAATMTEQGSP